MLFSKWYFLNFTEFYLKIKEKKTNKQTEEKRHERKWRIEKQGERFKKHTLRRQKWDENDMNTKEYLF